MASSMIYVALCGLSSFPNSAVWPGSSSWRPCLATSQVSQRRGVRCFGVLIHLQGHDTAGAGPFPHWLQCASGVHFRKCAGAQLFFGCGGQYKQLGTCFSTRTEYVVISKKGATSTGNALFVQQRDRILECFSIDYKSGSRFALSRIPSLTSLTGLACGVTCAKITILKQ